MNRLQRKLDYIERLILAHKLLVVSAILFWVLCIFSMEPEPIWGVGLVLPVFAIMVDRPKELVVYFVTMMVYIVVSLFLSHQVYDFVPHVACSVCVIGDSLLSRAISIVEKCQADLEVEKKYHSELASLSKDRELRIKDIKEKLDELYIMVEEDADTDDEVIHTAHRHAIRRKVSYLWEMSTI